MGQKLLRQNKEELSNEKMITNNSVRNSTKATIDYTVKLQMFWGFQYWTNYSSSQNKFLLEIWVTK